MQLVLKHLACRANNMCGHLHSKQYGTFVHGKLIFGLNMLLAINLHEYLKVLSHIGRIQSIATLGI